PDIYCKEGNMSILIEVTMLSSTQQNVRETPPVTAHLKKEMDKNNNSFTLFIAPIIHEQTTIFMNLTCLSYNISIITNTIKDFVLKIQNIEHLSQIKKIKK
ncbi:MAG: AlwI family type II restriction endonuclease, partial [Bacilli bacterium]